MMRTCGDSVTLTRGEARIAKRIHVALQFCTNDAAAAGIAILVKEAMSPKMRRVVQIAASRMPHGSVVRSKRPAKRDTEKAKRAAAQPNSLPGDRRRFTSAANLPNMAGRNQWRPTRCVIDLPEGGSREQTAEEAMTEARSQVRQLGALGLTQPVIAKLMRPPMDPATLRKHFASELALVRAQQTRRVALTAYQLAVSGKDPAMTRFWLRTRAGWGRIAPGQEQRAIIVQAMPGDDNL